MNIQNASMNMSQARVQESAGTGVQAMSLKNMKIMAEDLARLLESAKVAPNVISNPAMGKNVNMLM